MSRGGGAGFVACVALVASLGVPATPGHAQPTVYGAALPLVEPENLWPYHKPIVAPGELGAVVGLWTGQGTHALRSGALSGSNGALGEGEVSDRGGSSIAPPALATLPGGRALAVYRVLGGLRARPLDASGVPIDVEVRVDDPAASESNLAPTLAALPGPRFVVAWTAGSATDFAERITARFLSPDGEPLAPVFRVDQGGASEVGAAAVASDAAGDFVVAWEAHTTGAAREVDIHARRYDSSGAALTGEFLVNEATAAFQTDPSVVAGEGGDFLIAWSSEFTPGDASYTGLSLRRFDASGRGLTPEIRVNETVDGVQARPLLVRGGGDTLMAFWEQYVPSDPVHAIRARTLAPDGTPSGGEIALDTGGSAVRHDLTLAGGLASTGFLAAWIGSDLYPGDPLREGLIGQRVAFSPPIFRDGFEDESTDGWDEVMR